MTFFDEFEEHDRVAAIVLAKFKVDGCSVVWNPDKLGIDFHVIWNGSRTKVGSIEVENHGRHWKSYDFPFDSVHFLYNKSRHIGHGNFYVMWCDDLSNAVMIHTLELNNYRPVKVKLQNLFTMLDGAEVKEDWFWDIPIKNCILSWKDINKFLSEYFCSSASKVRVSPVAPQKPYLPNFVKKRNKDDGIVECSLCGCLFFSMNDFARHIDFFGVENHYENFKWIHGSVPKFIPYVKGNFSSKKKVEQESEKKIG